MFNFINKKTTNNVYAPISGGCQDITECKDETFSEKLLGDGFIIDPTEDIVCSPCDGELTMLFPTLHAFSLKMSNGVDILVHIGIDTVELNGKYFEAMCSAPKKIKKGTPVVKFDCNKIKSLGYNCSVIVILTNQQTLCKKHLNETVKCQELIIEE